MARYRPSNWRAPPVSDKPRPAQTPLSDQQMDAAFRAAALRHCMGILRATADYLWNDRWLSPDRILAEDMHTLAHRIGNALEPEAQPETPLQTPADGLHHP